MKKFLIPLFILTIAIIPACREENTSDCSTPANGTEYIDTYTLKGPMNFLSGYEAMNSDSSVNVVVEIPAGTRQKWEVDKESGNIVWTFKNGAPRVVDYLPYIGNYGMIPKTLLPEELGGDGDPLDVIILGEPIERGSVAKVRIIGVLRLLDGGEQDDKLIAVTDEGNFQSINDISELNENYTGVKDIIETWFVNYKDPGEMEADGFGNRNEALQILLKSIQEYANRN